VAGKDLEIRCPDCGSRIRLDPRTGAVIAHGPGERPQDLGAAARQHHDRQGSKDEAFRAAMNAERDRKQQLDDLFRKAADKARQDDTEAPPDRPQDDRWR
jgi:hypothetical protein